MSTNATLSATRRDGTGKGVARKLRAQGRVPAVLYGKDMESIHLIVDAHDAEHLFQGISVGSTIVDLAIEGDKKATQTLIREVQVHPYRSELIHIDFMRIQKGVAVDVEVPLSLDGTPEGVRTQGGILEQIVHDIPVRCLPSKIPEAITVDVTGLGIGDSLHASDLVVDPDVEILLDEDRTLVSVAAPRVIEEAVEEELEEVAAEGEAAAPEAAAEEEGGESGE